MNKKYRLEMPQHIDLGDSYLASALRLCSKQYGTIRGNENFKLYDMVFGFKDIPKDWLKELPEPMTDFEKWMDKEGYNKDTIISDITIHLKKCHEWTIENEKLKSEQKEECEHDYIIYGGSGASSYKICTKCGIEVRF
jgi:hypothetical protein